MNYAEPYRSLSNALSSHRMERMVREFLRKQLADMEWTDAAMEAFQDRVRGIHARLNDVLARQ